MDPNSQNNGGMTNPSPVSDTTGMGQTPAADPVQTPPAPASEPTSTPEPVGTPTPTEPVGTPVAGEPTPPMGDNTSNGGTTGQSM